MICLNDVSTLYTFMFITWTLSLGVDATESTEESVRLYNPQDNNDHQGLIQVKVNGTWGPLCGWEIGSTEAFLNSCYISMVICKQLGYSGYDNFYPWAEKKFDIYEVYSQTFYIGLACSSYDTRISNCSYSLLAGSIDQCSLGSTYGYAGVSCYKKDSGNSFLASGFGSIFRCVGWIVMFSFFGITYWLVRTRVVQQRQQRLQNLAVGITNNDQGVVIPPPRTAYQPPTCAPLRHIPNTDFKRSDISTGAAPANYQYPPQPLDVPPQYNLVVPPTDGCTQYPQSAPYPPTNAGSYPPSVGPHSAYPTQNSVTPYPPQADGAYPPQGAQNPAFPPGDYTPNENGTESYPSVPPPAYESIAGDLSGQK